MISSQKYRIVSAIMSLAALVVPRLLPFAGHRPLHPQRLQLHPLRPVLHNREVRLRLGVAELGDVDVVIGAGAVLLPGV